MNVEETLMNIGLSKAESKVYVSLLKLGRTRAGKIIKITNLQSSVVHNSLNTLLEKGFITYILVGSIKEYNALEPSIIEKYIETKKTEYKLILPKLKAMRKIQELDNAEVYEGYNGILSAMLLMLHDAKKGETFKYFAAASQNLTAEALKFFPRADNVRKQIGMKVKGIASFDTKELGDYSGSEIRFTKQAIPPTMNIFGDKILLMSLSSKPTAILIQSKEIANEYHKLWDTIWKKATPMKKYK